MDYLLENGLKIQHKNSHKLEHLCSDNPTWIIEIQRNPRNPTWIIEEIQNGLSEKNILR